jgi:hypothetical protein
MSNLNNQLLKVIWRSAANMPHTNVTTRKRASEIDAIQTRTDVHVNSNNNYPQASPLQIMTFYLVVGRLGCGSLVPNVSRYMQLSPIHVVDRAFRQQMCSRICHGYIY